jgi:hypothetical protein
MSAPREHSNDRREIRGEEQGKNAGSSAMTSVTGERNSTPFQVVLWWILLLSESAREIRSLERDVCERLWTGFREGSTERSSACASPEMF